MTAPNRRTETRHHPLGKTCHHFVHHGLSCDQYDELRARAAGCCELCRLPEQETGGRRLVVDHFQSGGLRFIRGMICDRCNSTMSCLDGTKPWGPKKVWEAAARAYEAHSWQQPTDQQRLRVEAIRKERYAAVARMYGRRQAA